MMSQLADWIEHTRKSEDKKKTNCKDGLTSVPPIP